MKAKLLMITILLCLSGAVVSTSLSACSAHIGPNGAGASVG